MKTKDIVKLVKNKNFVIPAVIVGLVVASVVAAKRARDKQVLEIEVVENENEEEN